MIYVEISPGARLGNILFQVAAGASLAERCGTTYTCIAPASRYEYMLGFSDSILRGVPVSLAASEETPPYTEAAIYEEPGFAFSEIPSQEDLILRGYFQSEKYFNRELVRRMFSVPAPVREQLRALYPGIDSAQSCSVSVRRGDYAKYPAMHPMCGKGYYRRAMSLMPEGTSFFIFSDDIPWCRRNLGGDNVTFIEGEPPATQIWLQSMCSNHIISNSSFAWWGAWLDARSHSKVIYPRNWFGIMYRHLDTSDLWPSHWTGIRNRIPLGVRVAALWQAFSLRMIKIAKRIRSRVGLNP